MTGRQTLRPCCMTSIADKLAEIHRRIVEAERRIAELKLAPTVDGLLLIEMASVVLTQLREYQKQLQSSLPSFSA
jgi:hypothetical protein